jgi:hypothetical protein
MPKPNLQILQRLTKLLPKNTTKKTLIYLVLGAFSKTSKKKLSQFSIPKPKSKPNLEKILVSSTASLQAMRL